MYKNKHELYSTVEIDFKDVINFEFGLNKSKFYNPFHEIADEIKGFVNVFNLETDFRK